MTQLFQAETELLPEGLSDADSVRSTTRPAVLNRIAASRDEMNLAEFPLAVLSTRTDPTIKTLEFSDSHRMKDGEIIERKWIITGADKFGLPTSTDDDVVLGLIRLTMDQGYRDPKVFFTRYELLKVLRWSTEGRSYARLTKSLDRLSGVRIRATNAFYDNSLKAFQTRNFGIIDAYEINDSRGGGVTRGDQAGPEPMEAPKSFFIWSEVLFESFRSGFIKKLDLDLYFSLKSAVSRRLYRYLDKHFYYRPSLEKPLMHLAFQKLGISRNYKYVSSIKQQIEPAAEELVRIGFLASFEFSGRGEDTVVRFQAKRQGGVNGTALVYPPQQLQATDKAPQPHRARNATSPAAISPAASSPQDSPERKRNAAVEALVSRGITLSQSRRLIEQKSVEELRQIDCILRYYDWLVENRDHKVSRNRIGFLYRAVEAPYKFIVPKEFGGQAAPRESGKQNFREKPSRRPELRVYRSAEDKDVLQKVAAPSKPNNQPEPKTTSSQQEFVRALVEERLKPLRSILGEARYTQVFDSLLSEELGKGADS